MEWVVVGGEWKSVSVLAKKSQQRVGWFQEARVVLVHTGLHGLLHANLEGEHVALAPAGGHGVHDEHVLVDLLGQHVAGCGSCHQSSDCKKPQHFARG